MEYRQLGKWGIRLSCLGLGSWLTIGGRCDDEVSTKIIKTAYDKGINFFDTADSYGGKGDTVSGPGYGESERLLGKVLKDYPRSSVVILTKVYTLVGPGPNNQGLSTKHIFESCHASLKRLCTDYLDIYMCHRPDPDVPLEETLRVMEDLAHQGKILYWGVSQFSAAQIIKAQAVARELGARPMAVHEPRYNMLYREPEHELFSVTAQEGIGNVTYSPLAHGVLTGKYLPGQSAPEATRAADNSLNRFMKKHYLTEEKLRRAQELVRIAREMDVTAAQLAIAWILRRPEVTSAILGSTKVEQLEENLKAAEIKIPEDIMTRLEGLYPLEEHYPIV